METIFYMAATVAVCCALMLLSATVWVVIRKAVYKDKRSIWELYDIF